MSADEEKLLANGKFEHLGGSVALSRIEVLMRAKYLIELGYKHFLETAQMQVINSNILLTSYLQY